MSTRLPLLSCAAARLFLVLFLMVGRFLVVQSSGSNSQEQAENGLAATTATATATVVNVTIWTTPIHESEGSLLLSLKDVILRLHEEQRLFFAPEMLVRNGTRSCRRQQQALAEALVPSVEASILPENKSCELDCLYHGRYCAVHLKEDTDPMNMAAGSQIVLESARRQCLWKLYGENSGPQLYFAYLEQLASSGCDVDLTTDCLTRIYHHLNISMEDIDVCVDRRPDQNYSTSDDEACPLLDQQVFRAEKMQVGDNVPQVFINGVAMETSSSMTTKAIFQAICDAYPGGTAPDICTTCLEKCVTSDDNNDKEDGSVSACLQGLSACDGDSPRSDAPDDTDTTSNDVVSETNTTIIHSQDMPESAPPTTGFEKLTDLFSKGGMDLYEMFDNCGVNMHAPMPIVNSILKGDVEDLESGAEQCTGDNVRVFQHALKSFEQHAGFDLMGWAQKNAASFGVAVSGCMKAFSELSETDEILNECMDIFMNDDTLARSLGTFLLWNTIVCPSLPKLQNNAPSCVYQKPGSEVALDGPLIQLSACLFGELCSHLDSLCEAEVAKLNQCLPNTGDEYMPCSAVEDTCKNQGALLFSSPPPLLGAIFPDRCQLFTVDREEYMHARIVERYNAYRRPCIMEQDTDEHIREFGDPEEHPGADSSTAKPTRHSNEEDFLHRWYNVDQYAFIEDLTRDPLVLGIAIGCLMGFMLLCIFCSRAYCRKRSSKRRYRSLQTNDSNEYFDQEVYRDNFEDEALQPPSWLVT